jgi:hypothetical protein
MGNSIDSQTPQLPIELVPQWMKRSLMQIYNGSGIEHEVSGNKRRNTPTETCGRQAIAAAQKI